MWGLRRFAQNETSEILNPAFPSVQMAQLFYEFLGRYQDWKFAKRQAMIGTIIVVSLGFFAIIMPWFVPKIGIPLSFGILIPFCFAIRYYQQVNERASHLYVNVHILHHHLSGKLEVGFCKHHEPCHCVEDFRGYVLEKHNICFNKDSL